MVRLLMNSNSMEMLVDSSLLKHCTVYLEAGDHESLLKLDQDGFSNLVMNSRQGTLAGAQLGVH